jgi:hypothetical protein
MKGWCQIPVGRSKEDQPQAHTKGTKILNGREYFSMYNGCHDHGWYQFAGAKDTEKRKKRTMERRARDMRLDCYRHDQTRGFFVVLDFHFNVHFGGEVDIIQRQI